MKRLVLVTVGALGLGFLVASCTTTYDAQGRPVQSVDPGAAVMAAAAAGVVGYALGDDDDDDYRYRRNRYYSHPGHPHKRKYDHHRGHPRR